jgi:hypothetical protein
MARAAKTAQTRIRHVPDVPFAMFVVSGAQVPASLGGAVRHRRSRGRGRASPVVQATFSTDPAIESVSPARIKARLCWLSRHST